MERGVGWGGGGAEIGREGDKGWRGVKRWEGWGGEGERERERERSVEVGVAVLGSRP